MSRLVTVFAPTLPAQVERLAYWVIDGTATFDVAVRLLSKVLPDLDGDTAGAGFEALVAAVEAEDAGGPREPVDDALSALLAEGPR